jgi:glycerol-3-phosphate acyltransferase PlsY
VLGRTWGLLVLLADALKGFVPAFFLAGMPGLPQGLPLGILFGACAVAGHNWPVYLRFRGGKGVATSAGVLIAVVPAATLVGLAVWLALALGTRYVSVASMGAAIAVAAFGWYRYGGQGLLLPVVLTVLAVLALWRHRSNIRRLREGTENRLSFRKGGKT